MKRYGIYGDRSGDFLTYGGRVLVHSSPIGDDRARAELEFLFPGSRVREVPAWLAPSLCLPVEMHPELAGIVQFPLTKEQFRRG